MFFTKTHTFSSSVPKRELQNRLLGRHVKIHNLDFEILERENSLMIIPHDEQVNAIKTLPITNVDMSDEGNNTRVVVTSRMRRVDSGGPQLLLIFCFFIFVAAFVLRLVDKTGDWTVSIILLSVDFLICSMFIYRLQTGYFDYVRKVRAYVIGKGVADAAGINATVAA